MTTVLMKNGMILILKFAFKKMLYSTYKKLVFQSRAYLSRNRMQTIYLSAIIFDVFDALATWYSHIAADLVLGPGDNYTKIYSHHLSCAHSCYLYYVKWISQWSQNLILQNSTMSFASKNYSIKDSVKLSSSHETQIILIEMV